VLPSPVQVVGDAAPGTTGVGGTEEAHGGEYEFLGGEDSGVDDLQTLAPATEEQAAAAAAARSADAALEAAEGRQHNAGHEANDADDEGMPDAAAELMEEGDQAAAAAAADPTAAPQAQVAHDRQRRGPAAQREKGPVTADMAGSAAALQQTDDALPMPSLDAADMDVLAARNLQGEAALVALRLEQASLGDGQEADFAPQLSEQQLAALRDEAEASLTEWRNANAAGADEADAVRAAALWARFEALTAPLAGELCEQLRLILEPTLAARMQGDYRTGKRLNMRKIIPYLASDFRRDKIWLRRSKPSVRRYQARTCAPTAFCQTACLLCALFSRFVRQHLLPGEAFRCEDENCPIAVLLSVRMKHNPLRSTERKASGVARSLPVYGDDTLCKVSSASDHDEEIEHV
jgi:midasin